MGLVGTYEFYAYKLTSFSAYQQKPVWSDDSQTRTVIQLKWMYGSLERFGQMVDSAFGEVRLASHSWTLPTHALGGQVSTRTKVSPMGLRVRLRHGL